MMKPMGKALVALALLAGCGNDGLWGIEDEQAPAAQPAGDDEVAAKTDPLTIALRLRATGIEGFSSLIVVPADVRAWADGVPVEVEMVGDVLDLASDASRFANVTLPEGARDLRFEIDLAPAGGYQTADETGWVDSRTTTLRFESSVENVLLKNKATIVLDAARSLVKSDVKTLKLVPKFLVGY